MSKKINIAIDGYSSCGKGTLAKNLAKELGYIFIDTGAMYRALTYSMLKNGIKIDDLEGIKSLFNDINITFKHNESRNFHHTLLNGIDIEEEIRSMEVSNMVSPVSAISIVREFLVDQQRLIGKNKGVVMDGRDIGTVVFPDAELKIFMTAKPEVRAQRRFDELILKGSSVTYEEVLQNINTRDAQDSSRANSPLKKANDAIVLDNSEMSKEEQNAFALEMALKIIGK